jgi:hypothetical protein
MDDGVSEWIVALYVWGMAYVGHETGPGKARNLSEEITHRWITQRHSPCRSRNDWSTQRPRDGNRIARHSELVSPNSGDIENVSEHLGAA